MTSMGIAAMIMEIKLMIISLRRLTKRAELAVSGVTRTRIAGVSPMSSSSPIWEVNMAFEGTK